MTYAEWHEDDDTPCRDDIALIDIAPPRCPVTTASHRSYTVTAADGRNAVILTPPLTPAGPAAPRSRTLSSCGRQSVIHPRATLSTTTNALHDYYAYTNTHSPLRRRHERIAQALQQHALDEEERENRRSEMLTRKYVMSKSTIMASSSSSSFDRCCNSTTSCSKSQAASDMILAANCHWASSESALFSAYIPSEPVQLTANTVMSTMTVIPSSEEGSKSGLLRLSDTDFSNISSIPSLPVASIKDSVEAAASDRHLVQSALSKQSGQPDTQQLPLDVVTANSLPPSPAPARVSPYATWSISQKEMWILESIQVVGDTADKFLVLWSAPGPDSGSAAGRRYQVTEEIAGAFNSFWLFFAGDAKVKIVVDEVRERRFDGHVAASSTLVSTPRAEAHLAKTMGVIRRDSKRLVDYIMSTTSNEGDTLESMLRFSPVFLQCNITSDSPTSDSVLTVNSTVEASGQAGLNQQLTTVLVLTPTDQQVLHIHEMLTRHNQQIAQTLVEKVILPDRENASDLADMVSAAHPHPAPDSHIAVNCPPPPLTLLCVFVVLISYCLCFPCCDDVATCSVCWVLFNKIIPLCSRGVNESTGSLSHVFDLDMVDMPPLANFLNKMRRL
jgi:hypothetical protein